MTDTSLPDGDYTLTDGAAWFQIGRFAIRLRKTDEGVSCAIYEAGKEDENSLAEANVFENELDEPASDEGDPYQIRHDMLGFYILSPEEAEHEDAGNPSAGFDGRDHWSTLELAKEALAEIMGN